MSTPDSAPDRRSALLAAAARCFAHGGFHATTVAEISLEAGCSPGLLYRYFAGKEALATALIEQEAARTVAAILGSAAAGAPPATQLAEVARRLSGAWYDPRSAALRVQIMAEAARGSAVSSAVRQHFEDVLAALTETLRQGQLDGRVDAALAPEATARLLVAIAIGLTTLNAVTDPPHDGAAATPSGARLRQDGLEYERLLARLVGSEEQS